MPAFLLDLVVVLGAALVVLLASRVIRLPTVLGFMLTGMLIGPYGLALIGDPHQVETIADLGVTLLLFVIGLEFSLARLKEFARAFALGGPLQVALTMGAVYLLLVGPLGGPAAFLAACLVSLSSTAMVFRLIADRAEFASPQGRVMTGILLFQDLAMVPMIALVPALAGTSGALAAGPRILLGVAVAGAAFVAARYVMPPLLALVARSGIKELFLIGGVFTCLGAAGATSALGLSAALGAFLAGIIVSESEYSHHIAAEILPFRDLFNSLFFVSIGMLIDLGFVVSDPVRIARLSVGILALKTVATAACVVAIGYPLRIAVIAGLGLAQIGEFSFVIGRLGRDAGLLGADAYQLFLASAVVTLGATPFLMALAPRTGAGIASLLPGPRWLGRLRLRRLALEETPPTEDAGLTGHVVIVGYGVNGRNLARVLKAVGIPYLVLDLDGSVVRHARFLGEEQIFLADATRPETLSRAWVQTAAAVVFAIADPEATRRGVKLVRGISASVPVLVRTRLVGQVEELRRLGANEVIPEEFETSIALFARVLKLLHVPTNVVRNQEMVLRSEGYEFLRGTDLTGEALTRITTLLAAGTTDSFLVEPGSPAAGRTLSDIALRPRTGASVVAIVREGRPTVSPGADFLIEAGDVLLIVGDHAAVDRAFEELAAPRG